MYRTIRTGDITFHVHQITHVQQIFEENEEVKAYNEFLDKRLDIFRDCNWQLTVSPFGISKEEADRYKEERDKALEALGEVPEPEDKTKVCKHRITLACGKQFKMDFNPLEEEYD